MDNNFLLTVLMPHPPVVIDEVGGAEALKVKNTSKALMKLSEEITNLNPDTVILITPHAHMCADYFTVYVDEKLKANFGKFGAPNTRFVYRNDLEFIEALEKNKKFGTLKKINDPVSIDHGAAVPLYFLNKSGYKGKVVIFNYSFLEVEDHLYFGKLLNEISAFLGRKTVFIASGDMSHRLIPVAPAGYAPFAKDFDNYIKENIEKGDYKAIIDVEEYSSGLRLAAGECGYNSLLVAFGFLDEKPQKNNVLSYEAPFGVGYLVATL